MTVSTSRLLYLGLHSEFGIAEELVAFLSQDTSNGNLEIKAGPIKIGKINSSTLNHVNYYYIKDPKIVKALDDLEPSDSPYKKELVLDKIRDDCKALAGVCKYKFNGSLGIMV